MIKRLLIIPARQNSKRIKNKNIKKLGGKPIICWSIKTAKQSRLFDEIHISTDSKKISNLVKKLSLKIRFFRNKKLSGDKVPLMDVFKFIINKYKSIGREYDEIWYLFPCSPLINANDLIKASKIFKQKKIKSLLAVSENSPPIQASYKKKQKFLTRIEPKGLKIRSQKYKKTYYDTGTFGAFKKEFFTKKIKLKFFGYEIPKWRGINIDTIDDWDLVKKIFRKKLN